MKRAIVIASTLTLAALAGCTTSGVAPYPNGTPIAGAYASANRAPRGSQAFCDTYGRQTAANAYEGNYDSGDSWGSNMFARHQAEVAGERAYRRCLAGRTN